MKILAVDSSSLVASVALVEDEVLLGEITLNYKKKHSEKLVPMIQQLLEHIELTPDNIDLFAAATGPGSFTGLRIGIMTVKSMAYAVDKPVAGVTTLDALAYNVHHFDGIICPIIDARNNQVYSALYRYGGTLENISGYMADDISIIISMINNYGSNVVFVGDAVWLHKDRIIRQLGGKAKFVPGNLTVPRASSVAHLAYKKALRNETMKSFDLVPFYLRKSQAERMLEEKKQNKK